MRRASNQSSSSMASGCRRAVGTGGLSVRGVGIYDPGWPDDSSTVEETDEQPEVFANKTVGQVADHMDQVIRGLNRKPANRRLAVPLTFEQFRFGFANAVSEEEAAELYETFAVPASGAPLFQAATANFNPWSEARVDAENPDRGPLLIVSGEKDNAVPCAIAKDPSRGKTQSGRDRDRGDSQPRARPQHR
jgi:non-heme chloroperoxidase